MRAGGVRGACSGFAVFEDQHVARLHAATLTLDDNRPGLRATIAFPPQPKLNQ